MKINCIILAGGKSSRMKFNKEYIKIDGEFLIHKNIEKLKKIFSEILVISNNFEHYNKFDVSVYRDIFFRKGPMAGLHSGLVNSNSNYSFLIACDMPNVDLKFINFLIENIEEKFDGLICLNEFDEIMPMYGIYKNNLKTKLKEELIKDNRKFKKFIEDNNFKYLSYNDYKNIVTTDIFENLNTTTDLGCFNKRLTK